MDQLDRALCAAGVLSRGDMTRLRRVLAKARRGEEVRVGVIGGSITEGALAATEADRWGNRVAQWWRDRFPDAKFDFVNAGIGATGSDLGSHRVAKDLLARPIDFVVAEYAMNDVGCPLATETLEGMTRQILAQANQPAMMLLFLMNDHGVNVQEKHISIGEHYGLPMVSFRDALWPQVQAGRLVWSDFEADFVHPNSRGHGYCAQFVTTLLEEELDRLPADSDIPPAPPLPSPLMSDVFQFTTLHHGETLMPNRNVGWTPFVRDSRFGTGWQANTPGSALEFTVEGTAISLLYFRIKGDLGMLEAQVDDLPPVKIDAWYEADWGGYMAYHLLGRDLAPGGHCLRLTLLEEKNAQSGGNLFQLQAVLEAGLKSRT